MPDPATIALLALLAIAASTDPMSSDSGTLPALASVVGGQLLVVFIAGALFSAVGRGLDRTGSMRMVALAGRCMLAMRVGAVSAFAVSLFVFGWLGVVRSWVGDWILVDEALALLPGLGGLVAVRAVYFPIERRVLESRWLGILDHDGRLPRLPTCGKYVWDWFRHSSLMVLIPVGLIVLSSGLVVLSGVGSPLLEAMEVLVVVCIAAITPWILVRLWGTVPLGAGEMRDRLMSLCRRHRVMISDLRVWWTPDGSVNGALLGLFPGLRYILLTDGLLERLPDNELEAVMAHEVGHARHRHVPWTLAAVGGSLVLLTTGVSSGVALVLGGLGVDAEAYATPLSLGSLLVSLPMTLVVFGFISRRFEWQADAFAAQHMSGLGESRADAGVGATEEPVITGSAALAMSGALRSVSRASGIPSERFTLRHGTIGERRRRLLEMVGEPMERLAIDRSVRRLKTAILIACVLAAGLVGLEMVMSREMMPEGVIV